MTLASFLPRVPCAALVLVLAACGKGAPEAPKPQAMPADAVGHYCNMLMSEHDGPKGQIFLKSEKKPIWFSSVRDTVTFVLLPEEPKDIAAIYVTDMTSADWGSPGNASWIDARDALYVIGSDRMGGMGAPEPVPFAGEAGAKAFQAAHGGKIVRFDAIPRDYVLGDVGGAADPGGHDDGHGEGRGDDRRGMGAGS